jgi:hypothetical protein
MAAADGKENSGSDTANYRLGVRFFYWIPSSQYRWRERRRLWTAGILFSQLLGQVAFDGDGCLLLGGFLFRIPTQKAADENRSSPEPPAVFPKRKNHTLPVGGITAMRLGRYFKTTPGIWMSLQAQYELEVAERKNGAEILRSVPEYAVPD